MRTGKVYLVGAGPGAADLMTVRAQEILRRADVVVYDYLVDSSALYLVPRGCEKVDVGKRKGFHALPQEEIEQLLLARAREGKCVVRLKGGDPLIFGRGGEEAQFLLKNGVDCEIVPGITAALGAAAELGLPLTHRALASSVTLVTGHEDPEKKTSMIDWEFLAKNKGTLCLYMGMGHLQEICDELQRHGLSSETPAAVVRWATTPKQEVLRSPLGELYQRVTEAEIKSPAMVFIGASVGEILWERPQPQGPLSGRRIAVTRPREQARPLVQALEQAGAEVISLPLISIHADCPTEIRNEVFEELGCYEWLVFTSRSGVRHFFDHFFQQFDDIRSLGMIHIAAVGAGTQQALAEYRLCADLVPDTADAESLAQKLIDEHTMDSARILVVTGNLNRPVLVQKLEEARAIVDVLPVYRTELNSLEHEPEVERFRLFGVDAITFTSGSTVDSFIKQAKHLQPVEKDRPRPYTVSIGSITSEALRAAGIPVDMEAKEASHQGIVQALVEFFTK